MIPDKPGYDIGVCVCKEKSREPVQHSVGLPKVENGGRRRGSSECNFSYLENQVLGGVSTVGYHELPRGVALRDVTGVGLVVIDACEFQCDGCIREIPTQHHPVRYIAPAVTAEFDAEPLPVSLPPSVMILRDACTSEHGYVTGSGVTIKPKAPCQPEAYIRVTSLNCGHVYDEIVVIPQYWGGAFYHFMHENAPRLALVAPYLRAHPNTKIQVLPDYPIIVKEVLEAMGLWEPSRIVHGCCAKRILLPEPVTCGRPSAYHLLNLRRELAHLIPTILPDNQRHLLLIRRPPGARSVINYDELETALRASFDLPVVVFDSPPSLANAFALWANARIAVAPHGAAAANMIASHAPFAFIEFIDSSRNRCFEHAAAVLGFEYSMLMPEGATHSAPMTVDVPFVVDVVNKTLLKQQLST